MNTQVLLSAALQLRNEYLPRGTQIPLFRPDQNAPTLGGMSKLDDQLQEGTAYEGESAGPAIPRLIGAALKRERKRTREMFDEFLLAVKAEIGYMEERVGQKLYQIDTSVSLMAQELSRKDRDLEPE